MPVEHEPIRHDSAETRRELEAMAAERAEQHAKAEVSAEQHAEKQANDAEAARRIIDKEDEPTEATPAAEASEPRPSFTAKLTHALNYKETMASMEQKLSPARRRFSHVIHAPAVEKTSEALERTVMRPSVTVGAVATTLIVAGIFYFFARTYGYAMRGSELIVSLLVGGLLGFVIELIARAFRRRR